MTRFGFDPAEYRDAATKQVARVIDTALRQSGALDEPIPVTIFHNIGCTKASRFKKPWGDICNMLREPDIISGGKLSAPMIKLAVFGDERNPDDQQPDYDKRSLRYSGNMLKVTGIEGDYDAGVMPMEEAVRLLEKAGIRAVLYSSWGDGLIEPPKYLGGPRWRVLAPFSRELPPGQRAQMVARLNGALGGVLADESFTMAQGFFIGARPGGDYKFKITFQDPYGGEPIDTLDTLDEIALHKRNFSNDDAGDEKYSVEIRPGSVIVAPETYAELRAALSVIPADCDNFEWFSVLRGLSRLSNTMEAKSMARDWSTSSPNPEHNEAVFNKEWARMSRENTTISHRKVLWLAKQHDPEWNLQNKSQRQKADEPHPLSLSLAVDSGASRVSTIEYLFDRFMSTGVNIVAGAPGVGKTTLIVPLALAAAHLCPADYALRPRVRRNVIIITESVVQVQRVIYSVAQWGCTGMSEADFDARVRVISARRLDPELVSEVAAEYVNWTVDNPKVDGTLHSALPLVVFDTANAVLELESENDNAEVGRAMAHLKQRFCLFPVIIVAHTSKALGRGEAEGLAARGASAWTGDAQGTYMVFKDGEDRDAPRVLKSDKVRFPTAFDEVALELVSHSERHPNILGEMEDEWFTHSVARPLARGERTQLKEDAKELRAQDEWVTLCDEMLQLVRDHPEHSRSYYEQLPKTRGGPRGSQERKERAMTALINDGCLKIVELEKPKGRADHYLRVDEAVVSSIEKGRYEV